jgi:hypothetical protein
MSDIVVDSSVVAKWIFVARPSPSGLSLRVEDRP